MSLKNNKDVLKKVVLVGVLCLTFFSISSIVSFAQNDNEESNNKAFEMNSKALVDIQVTDSNASVIGKGKGMLVSKEGICKNVVASSELIANVAGASNNTDQINIRATLSNGVEVSLTELVSSKPMGVSVFNIDKEIKNDLIVKYAHDEKNLQKDVKAYICNPEKKGESLEVGSFGEFSTNAEMEMVSIAQSGNVKLGVGDFVFDENGVCIGMITNDKGTYDAISMYSVTELFDQFDVGYNWCSYVNKDDLKKALDDAQSVGLSKYKKDSANDFKDVLKSAQNCYDSDEVTKSDIENKISELKSAKDSLKLNLTWYIVIGVVAIVGVIALIIFSVIKKKKKNRQLEEDKRQARLKRIDTELRGERGEFPNNMKVS